MLKTTSSDVFFCPQPDCIQFTVTAELSNKKIFTWKKLESENFDFVFFFYSITQVDYLIILIAGN